MGWILLLGGGRRGLGEERKGKDEKDGRGGEIFDVGVIWIEERDWEDVLLRIR